MEGSTETAYKSQYTTTIGASIWTCTQPSVHSSSIYCSQDMETTQVLINRLYNMYTHTHTHTHTHTYTYIHICIPGGSVIKNPPAMQEMQEMWF